MSFDAAAPDKAAWKGFSDDNKDRCEVCNERATVRLTALAQELPPQGNGANGAGGSNGVQLARAVRVYCASHGQLRMKGMVDALKRV